MMFLRSRVILRSSSFGQVFMKISGEALVRDEATINWQRNTQDKACGGAA